ncbi:unnamed protein product, partial [Musa acuminata subsp. burmannicoides]
MKISSCLMLISFPWVARRLDGNMPSGVPLKDHQRCWQA